MFGLSSILSSVEIPIRLRAVPILEEEAAQSTSNAPTAPTGDCSTDDLELGVRSFFAQFVGPQALVREVLVLGSVRWLVHVRGHTSERVRAHALEHVRAPERGWASTGLSG